MSDEIFDPLGIGPGAPKEEPEPSPVPLDEELAPTLPMELGRPVEASIVPAGKGDFGLPELSKENVNEKRQVYLPEINLPTNVTEEQKQLVQDAVKDVVLYGARASAMVCKGRECPYASKCPLLRAEVPVPIGSECPVELYAMQIWLQQYYREMEINPYDVGAAYDITSAQMMAGLKLQINRASWGEAMNPLLEQEVTSVTNQFKNIIKVGNFNTDYREKAIKALNNIAKNNMQTRERKVALMKSGFKDKSKHAAEVTERLNQIKEEEKIVEMGPTGAIEALHHIKRFSVPKEDIDNE